MYILDCLPATNIWLTRFQYLRIPLWGSKTFFGSAKDDNVNYTFLWFSFLFLNLHVFHLTFTNVKFWWIILIVFSFKIINEFWINICLPWWKIQIKRNERLALIFSWLFIQKIPSYVFVFLKEKLWKNVPYSIFIKKPKTNLHFFFIRNWESIKFNIQIKIFCCLQTWHKTCFKCHECGMTLNMKTYKGFNKLPYCEA